MDSEKILSALSRAGFYADARISSGFTSGLSLEDGKLTGVEGEITGMGVRALVNGSFGYAWSSSLHDFPALLKRAERLARLNKGKSKLCEPKTIRASAGKIYQIPQTEERIALLREARKFSLSKKARNSTLLLRDLSVEKTFLSSEGSFISEKQSYSYFSSVSVAKDGIQAQRGMDRLSSRKGYSDFDLCKTARNALESAERLLNSGPSPKGRFPVIMDPEMTGVFSHEALGHASEGDSIVERESLLRGKIGKKIAHESVSITDDPTFDSFGQYFYDDEGVRAQPVPIIEKGVLKNYLHSRGSAFSLKTASNGHARAESPAFPPVVRMSNTLFQKGSANESEVFDVKQGIYVIGMKGGSVDIFSGNFMFAAKEAYLVKNGSKEKILRDVTVSGHILETLGKVERVGKDFGTSPGFCGKMAQSVPVSDGGPHVRVSEMKIG
ncbi:MAG: TldD/PmbA family protein [Candidatus Micrarchaeia archaeon]